jgi:hypothetical protein
LGKVVFLLKVSEFHFILCLNRDILKVLKVLKKSEK